jgi:diguanylate cyclase (GGDEF)-like protein/PAS domain S-box-containing protein
MDVSSNATGQEFTESRALTLRYVVALCLVATLSTAAWFSLDLVIAEQKATAAVVNVSGRQRMLSQRIALFSELLVATPEVDRPQIRSQLSDAIRRMEHAHKGLTRGDMEMGLPSTMSETVRRMYFNGPDAVSVQVETYIRTADELLALQGDWLSRASPQLNYIRSNAQNRLITSLDQMVGQYQREGETAVSRLQLMETAFWICTLVLLVLEALLIFNPFVWHVRSVIGKLRKVSSELQDYKEHLEELVRLRTEELRAKSAALKASEERLTGILDETKMHLWAFDGETFPFVNRQWFEFTGQEPSDHLTPALWSSVLHPDDATTATHVWQKHWNARAECDNYFRLRRHDGVYRDFYSHAVPRYDEQGEFKYFQGFNLDITERKQLEDQVRQLAFFDPLTHLPNRRLLMDRMGQAMAAGKRSGRHGALMFLDLDNFKPLNDSHGHTMGDLLLVEVAKRLTACTREFDTVARFGGDEFVVMLSNLDQDQSAATDQALAIAEKIRLSVSRPYRLRSADQTGTGAEVEHHCSISVGVAIFLGNVHGDEEVLQWADAAMYQAKNAGRNQIRVSDRL